MKISPGDFVEATPLGFQVGLINLDWPAPEAANQAGKVIIQQRLRLRFAGFLSQCPARVAGYDLYTHGGDHVVGGVGIAL